MLCVHGQDVDVRKQFSNATMRESNDGISRSNAEDGTWLFSCRNSFNLAVLVNGNLGRMPLTLFFKSFLTDLVL